MPEKSPSAWGPYSGTKSPSVLPFFLLVFALAVPFWIIGMVVDVQPLPGLPIAAAMFVCPALAALILTYRDRGRMGVAALLCRSFDGGRIPKRWYLPIMMLMPGVAVASFALERWTGMAVPAPHIALLPATGLFLVFMVGALGEELGWTGFVLDRLLGRWGAVRSGLLLGGIWAIWHWVALTQAHRSPAWIAWWSLGTVSMRIIMVGLYNQAGRSLFGVAVIHAMFNLCWQLFPAQGSYFDPRLNGLILAAVALAAIVVTRGTLRLAPRPASGEY
jgi:membrane protease YdiL (CAAX protease family)